MKQSLRKHEFDNSENARIFGFARSITFEGIAAAMAEQYV